MLNMESSNQSLSNFSRAMQEYLSVKIDTDNFDASRAADKFEASYRVYNMFSEPVNKPTDKELNFFARNVGGSGGTAKFLSSLSTEQQDQMYLEIKKRDEERNKQS